MSELKPDAVVQEGQGTPTNPLPPAPPERVPAPEPEPPIDFGQQEGFGAVAPQDATLEASRD